VVLSGGCVGGRCRRRQVAIVEMAVISRSRLCRVALGRLRFRLSPPSCSSKRASLPPHHHEVWELSRMMLGSQLSLSILDIPADELD
jgi:hypothetical protein